MHSERLDFVVPAVAETLQSVERYHIVTTHLKLEMRSVERGICPIATSIMNELFQ